MQKIPPKTVSQINQEVQKIFEDYTKGINKINAYLIDKKLTKKMNNNNK